LGIYEIASNVAPHIIDNRNLPFAIFEHLRADKISLLIDEANATRRHDMITSSRLRMGQHKDNEESGVNRREVRLAEDYFFK
jgi:hypothetical protein